MVYPSGCVRDEPGAISKYGPRKQKNNTTGLTGCEGDAMFPAYRYPIFIQDIEASQIRSASYSTGVGMKECDFATGGC
jgi:hypothetical protein